MSYEQLRQDLAGARARHAEAITAASADHRNPQKMQEYVQSGQSLSTASDKLWAEIDRLRAK